MLKLSLVATSGANTPITMTSREIAELTGKALSHVHRDIRVMVDALKKDEFFLDHPHEDQDARGYTTCIYLNRELTETLLTGYSAPVRLKVIRRWRELEAMLAAPVAMTTMDILKIAMEAEQGRLLAVEQRDHAISTKAQIGSKREATAMARVALANKEVARLKDQLGFSVRQATILQVEGATGREFNFVDLRRWCQANEVIAETVPDKRYPKGVKAWPTGAWMDCYGVDLIQLFGAAA